MKKQQSGFTLIELIMVIVILGALAVAVIPRYVDLQAQAEQAAVDGVAGSLAAGSAINYAECIAGGGGCLTSSAGVTWDDCDDADTTLIGGMPTGFSIGAATAWGAVPIAAGTTQTCTVTGPTALTATFTQIATP